MKQETKELIRWAEEHFRQYRINIQTHPEKHGLGPYGVDKESNYSTDFLHFLKTLPDIENKLCFGGYIQDRNGTPCCHGDKIKFKIYDNEWMSHLIEKYGAVTEGKLRWNPYMKAFCVDFGDGDWLDFTAANDGIEWFEKAER